MVIFAIHSEQALLDELRRALAEAAPHAKIFTFAHAGEALEAVEVQGERPNVVFSNIEFLSMSAAAFVARLRKALPTVRLVFVSAHPDYAVEAFRMHANGFIVGPASPARIREELDALFGHLDLAHPAKLRVRCFGNFDVFVGSDPLVFGRQRSKELLAVLVDRVGGTCTSGEIATALWEGKEDKKQKSYLRVLTSDLKKTLAAHGLEEALIHKHGQWAMRKDYLDCDYYRLLEGDPDALDAYCGEYMKQYSWAEATNARLHFTYGI